MKLDGGGTAISAVTTQESDQGLRVNIGVRPEDLVKASGGYIFKGIVKFTEALGEVTLLYFEEQGAGNGVIGKLPGVHTDVRGTSISLTAALEKVQVFHNGQSLYYR